ncbi:MAG: polyamine ABC transporter substrate-binding protein [Betaproteobacteria bacterium]|nr:polyamine ABC transporter substrate-binding protein [Betaproteobacteria bacterium]
MKLNNSRPGALLLVAAALASPVALADETLNVYNWSDYIAEDTVAKFEEETGIKVNYDVYDSNEVLEAKLLTGNTGYDIVVPTSDYLERGIAAGVFQKLDKNKLANLANLDPELMARMTRFDPDNAYSVIYMWGTNGLGYNAEMISERLGEDAPVDSWRLLLDPKVVSKLADCGVAMLDSGVELISSTLNYIGLDPESTSAADMEEGFEALRSIRPYIRYFHSSQIINDLANGEICLAFGYSGDILQAADRAAEADNGIQIEYVIPKEGAQLWFDLMAIPADAPNPDAAHKFIDFIMRPEITADITNYVAYANANLASRQFVDEEILNSPAIFPDPETKQRLWNVVTYDAELTRLLTRFWIDYKTGG